MGTNEEEIERFCKEIREKESFLDNGRIETNIGVCSRATMERMGLAHHIKGKTRIVIEYDDNTGKGYKRIVSEA